MPKSSADPIVAENLKAILKSKKRSAYSVATALGYAPNGFYQVLTGRHGILLPTLREVAKELGVSVGELVDQPNASGVRHSSADTNSYTCPTASQPTRAVAEPLAAYNVGKWRDIPIAQVAASCGDGATVFDESVNGYQPFAREWLIKHQIDPEQSVIITARGDSMEPTIHDGSSILVDRSRREPQDERIYVMRSSEGLVAKRLRHDATGHWHITSDNPVYPPSTPTEKTEILGEVRWMGKTLA